jgi:hypothetical protein
MPADLEKTEIPSDSFTGQSFPAEATQTLSFRFS